MNNVEIVAAKLQQSLQPQLVKTWLESQEQDTIGRNNNSYSCPIAKYLTSQVSKDDFEIKIGFTVWYVHSRKYDELFAQENLPQWVQAFVGNIDKIGNLDRIVKDEKGEIIAYNPQNSTIVTKTECLIALEKAINDSNSGDVPIFAGGSLSTMAGS